MPAERVSSDHTLREKPSDDDNSKSQAEQPQKDKQDQEEKDQEGPPLPVGFWDPSLKGVRSEVIKKWALTSRQFEM